MQCGSQRNAYTYPRVGVAALLNTKTPDRDNGLVACVSGSTGGGDVEPTVVGQRVMTWRNLRSRLGGQALGV